MPRFSRVTPIDVRYHACTRKQVYETKKEAREGARRVFVYTRETVVPYGPCRFCGKFHIGHKRRR